MRETASKKFQRDRNRLLSGFIKKNEGDFSERHARLVDAYFYESYEKSKIGPRLTLKENPYAIIALGGYGRREQCVFSDIDLLFLFRKSVPAEAGDLIQEIVYPLWDLGMEVGYSTLSLKESLHKARNDYEMLIPLLDARFICGMSLLFSELTEGLNKKIVQKRSRQILSWLVEQSQRRHTAFGDSSYLLEPNLKEGQGGLRDYHSILWIARIEANLKEPRDLEYAGFFLPEEFRQLKAAVSYVSEVRNRLHNLVGRKCDQLYFEHQVKLARELNYTRGNGQEPVEIFLGELHAQMEFVKHQHLIFLHELGLIKAGNRKVASTRQALVAGLEIKRDMINFIGPDEILKRPVLLIKVFEESARMNLPLSAEAKRLVKEFSTLATQRFITSPEVLASFEQILIKPVPTFNVLNEMLNTGILVKMIPEIKGVINRIQYDEYHLYPVDKHLLRTVHTLKDFASSQDDIFRPLCGKLYKELKNKRLLLWATLLHDIGKGEPGGNHSNRGGQIVRKVLAKKGLNSEEIETVVFLVKEHLLLIEAATRRDIEDEETAIFCARQVKRVSRLKMLYLLTVADSIATGPKAWNEWTATLLRDLFLRVLGVLEKGELATQEAVEAVEQKKETIIRSDRDPKKRKEREALFNFVSPRYLLYTPAEEIVRHINLYQSLDNKDFVWRVSIGSEPNTREVTICAQDRPGLFSKISGIFTLNRLDILDAKVYTWRNHIALDVFTVKPPPDQIFEEEKWVQARENLESALKGELDLAAALNEMVSVYRQDKPAATARRPHQVVVDNKSSSFFTIVEVYTYDFPGLLFCITDALFRCRLNVWVAKIATKVDQVVDVFYVRDFDGQKVDSPHQISIIKKTITEILAGRKTRGGL
jgi:[protein-PII] uridylyltransferase